MGGHGHQKIEIPDYKIYKVKDAPELLAVQERLAARGLKDPWLRNEVWRYHPSLGRGSAFYTLIFRGFKYGFGLCALSIVIEEAYKRMNPSNSHGHH